VSYQVNFPPQLPVETMTERDLLLDVCYRVRALNDWHHHVNNELASLHDEDAQLGRKVGRDGWLTRAFGIGTLVASAVFTHWLNSGRLLP
jgi:hypothetical protein